MSRHPIHTVVALPDGAEPATARSRFAGPAEAVLPPPGTPVPGGHRVHLSTGNLLPTPTVAAVARLGPVTSPTPGLDVRGLHWHAESADGLFPTLQGDLELHTTERPELRLVGFYVPPFAVVGAAADRLVGRHLATEVIRSFVTGVCRRLASGALGEPPAVTEPRIGG